MVQALKMVPVMVWEVDRVQGLATGLVKDRANK